MTTSSAQGFLRTEAEELFDNVVQQQREKGRRHYGGGLAWEAGDGDSGVYDWRQMALEEAVDLSQYLCAELLKERFRAATLTRSLRANESPNTPLTLSEYQSAALRTAAEPPSNQELAIRALGLAGEAGEVVELIKKYLGHGHTMDVTKLQKELGDVLWYVATLADAVGLQLEDVAAANIEKLRQRYPDGFSSEASRNRSE